MQIINATAHNLYPILTRFFSDLLLSTVAHHNATYGHMYVMRTAHKLSEFICQPCNTPEQQGNIIPSSEEKACIDGVCQQHEIQLQQDPVLRIITKTAQSL